MIDIEAIKRKLLVKYAPFGSVVANVGFKEEDSVPTAGTDGKTIYYNSKFVESLTEKETTFLFAHEICHIAFDHIYRSEGKDGKIWNIATDAVINAMLKKDKLPLMKGGVDREDGNYLSAEELYEKLLKEQKQENQNSNQDESEHNDKSQEKSNQNSSNTQGDGQASDKMEDKQESSEGSSKEEQQDKDQDVGHDTHEMWKKAVKERQEERKKSQENDKGEENPSTNKTEPINEQEVFKQLQIERKKQLEELRKSIVKESHTPGAMSNGEVREVNEIGVSKPLIDWRRLLKEAIKFDVDWTYQNASVEDGVVTPYLEELPKPETEIVLDTSGSIDENLLRNFLRECKNILQNSKVKVGCFDTRFYGFTEIRSIEDIDRLTFQGGGGTNFDVAVSAFTKRVENKIIFTDGEASMPSMSLDAVWVVFGSRKIAPPGGKVIPIDEEALENLSYDTSSKHRR